MKILVMGAFLLGLSGCDFIKSDKSNLRFSEGTSVINPVTAPTKDSPNNNKPVDPQFLALKAKLFDASCIKCHNPKSAAAKGRLDLTNQDLIVENLDKIIYRMTDAFDMGFDYMPPEGPQVAPEIIKELKAWKKDQAFVNVRKNLFEVSCTKCHNPDNKRHIDLTSKDVVIEHYDEILYRMTKAFDESNKPMPPPAKGARVSAEMIKLLEDWKASL